MAHQATTRRLPEPPAAAAAQGHSAVGLDALTEALWNLLTSMRFALALMLVMAALALVGALLMQMPSGVAADPDARASWLGGVRPKYGGWTGLLDQLGMFSVFTSLWFRATVMGLTISLLACSLHRLPGIWHTATKPQVDVGAPFFEHAPEHEQIHVRQSPGDLREAAVAVLRRHRYRTIVHDDGTLHLYADRNRWAPLGSLAGHLSLVVILAGGIVGSTFGFRDDQFMIAEGSSAQVPGKPGVTVRLDAFRDSYYAETGAPSDYASDLVVLRDGQEVARQTVRVNEPLRYDDLSFFQSFYGAAAILSVTDASGTTVLNEGVPLAWDSPDGLHRIGTFALPAQDLAVWVIGTSGPDDPVVKPGQMRLEVYRASGDGGLVTAQTVTQRQPAEVAGLSVLFVRETQFSGLSISKDPGAPLVWLGGLMLFLGVVCVFMFPSRRLWGRLVARPGGGATLALAAVGRRGDSTFINEFTGLVDEIRKAAVTPQGA